MFKRLAHAAQDRWIDRCLRGKISINAAHDKLSSWPHETARQNFVKIPLSLTNVAQQKNISPCANRMDLFARHQRFVTSKYSSSLVSNLGETPSWVLNLRKFFSLIRTFKGRSFFFHCSTNSSNVKIT